MHLIKLLAILGWACPIHSNNSEMPWKHSPEKCRIKKKQNLKFKTFAEQETLSCQLSQAAARRT